MLCRTWREKHHFITMPNGYRRMDTPSKNLGQGEMILAAIDHFLSASGQKANSPRKHIRAVFQNADDKNSKQIVYSGFLALLSSRANRLSLST